MKFQLPLNPLADGDQMIAFDLLLVHSPRLGLAPFQLDADNHEDVAIKTLRLIEMTLSIAQISSKY
jgi:hypothetical protein